MAELDGRVAALEKEMAALKARVEIHNAELVNIPELIKVEFRFVNSRFSRIDQELSDAREQGAATTARLDKLTAEFERFPRVVAEVVKEILDERDRGRK